MKVLMFSLDQTILKDGSKSQKRMVDYGEIVDELDIVLYTPFSKTCGNFRINSKVSVYPTNNRLNFFYFWSAFKLGKKLIKDKDLITTQDVFPTGIIGYILKKRFKVPLQIQVHIDFFSPYFWKETISNKIYVFCANFLLPRVDNVRVVSHEIKSYLIDKLGVSADKIITLPVFADFGANSDYSVGVDLHEKYPQFDFIILITTRLVKQKNLDMAIEAIKLVARNHPQIGLIIIGSGPEEKRLKAMSKELGNIIFEPWVYDVYPYYHSADLFLLTSNYEGWGRTIIEAMSAGLPVITTPVGCANEIIRDRNNGIITPFGSAEVLAETIEYLYQNPDKRREMAFKGQETVKNLRPTTKEEYLALSLQSFKNGLP